jgi:hypothetical protein
MIAVAELQTAFIDVVPRSPLPVIVTNENHYSFVITKTEGVPKKLQTIEITYCSNLNASALC